MNDKLKIAYIAAGAGGMYCGSCIRDNSLARAIRELGHDIALIPTYTPMRTDEHAESIDRVFYNGISVYLEQKFAWARNRSGWLDWLMDRPGIVNYLAKVNASTNARDLGELTVSMLKGEDGFQRKELQKLVDWLKNDYKPQIVQITNSMLAGMAKEIKNALDVPVLCALQGEDIFLDDLIEPYRTEAIALLRKRAKDMDGFIATSDYYRNFMSEYLAVPTEKIHSVRLGIGLDGHGKTERNINNNNPFVIGYLARICPEKGLHVLVDAVAELAKRTSENSVRLKIAGYLGKRDHHYFEGVKTAIRNHGIEHLVEHVGEVDRTDKIAFLNSLDVLSVPTVYHEPKGLFLLEALANGVPAVQPNHGAFPEILSATGGGVLFEPDSPCGLADALHGLLENPDLRAQLGKNGKSVVHRDFSDQKMAMETLNVYQQYLGMSVADAAPVRTKTG